MSTQSFSKLVRDRIPEIMTADGAPHTARTLEGAELRAALVAKLHEEADEIGQSATAPDTLEELADAFEVIRALALFSGYTIAEVAAAADAKGAKRGTFNAGIWVSAPATRGQ